MEHLQKGSFLMCCGERWPKEEKGAVLASFAKTLYF